MPPPDPRRQPPAQPQPADVQHAGEQPVAPDQQTRPRRRRRRRRQPPPPPVEVQEEVSQQTAQVQQSFHQQTQTRVAAALQLARNQTVQRLWKAARRSIVLREAQRMSQAHVETTLREVTTELQAFSQRIAVQTQQLQEEAYREAMEAARRLVRRLDKDAEENEELEDQEAVEELMESRRERTAQDIEGIVSDETTQMQSSIRRKAQTAAAAGRTHSEVVEEIIATFEAEFYRFMRAIRTYIARVYNSALADAAVLLSRRDDRVYLRWTEHVSDVTWEPTDGLTARDSIVMHGQVRRPDKLFTMPRDEGVTPKLWDKQFDYPPNRPNDRAIVMPWRKKWGVPSYEFKGYRRVWLVPR